MAVGYIKVVNVSGIDNCNIPSARCWLLLTITTKSSQGNVNTCGVPHLILWGEKPAP